MTFLFFSSVLIVVLWILFQAVTTRDMNLLCILIKGIGSQRIPSISEESGWRD